MAYLQSSAYRCVCRVTSSKYLCRISVRSSSGVVCMAFQPMVCVIWATITLVSCCTYCDAILMISQPYYEPRNALIWCDIMHTTLDLYMFFYRGSLELFPLRGKCLAQAIVYLLCSFEPDSIHIIITNGLSQNGIRKFVCTSKMSKSKVYSSRYTNSQQYYDGTSSFFLHRTHTQTKIFSKNNNASSNCALNFQVMLVKLM